MRRNSAQFRPHSKTNIWEDAGFGLSCFGSGLKFISDRPKLWLSTLWPAFGAGAILALFLWAWWYLSGWFADLLTVGLNIFSPWIQQAASSLLCLMLFVMGVFFALMAFSGLAIVIGAPVWEEISAQIDSKLPVSESVPIGTQIKRALKDFLVTLKYQIKTGFIVFLISLIPVLGQMLAPLITIFVGAWFIALEVMAPACERRAMGGWEQRKRLLSPRFCAGLGLGIPVYLALLIPVLGISVFPAAVAAGTLLTKELDANKA